MTIARIEGISVLGIAGSIPKQIVKSSTYRGLFPYINAFDRVIKSTGIQERRLLNKDKGSLELGIAAANRLMDKLKVDRAEIELVINVSQTTNYRQPGNAPLLQDALGLSSNVAAFDINIGCAGFVYGMSVAASMLNALKMRKVLLVIAEVPTRMVSSEDKVSAHLFGDAGAALVMERDTQASPMYISLHTDGSGSDYLNIKGGGYLIPSSHETVTVTELPDGTRRSAEHLHMDGLEVFKFTLREVVSDLEDLMRFANLNLSQINHLVLHQANKMIINHLCKKLGIEDTKVLTSIERFGNTSSTSIPLTLAFCLSNEDLESNLVRGLSMLSGYGSGLSWGSIIMDLERTAMCGICEIE